jgi:hypothetical protein
MISYTHFSAIITRCMVVTTGTRNEFLNELFSFQAVSICKEDGSVIRWQLPGKNPRR